MSIYDLATLSLDKSDQDGSGPFFITVLSGDPSKNIFWKHHPGMNLGKERCYRCYSELNIFWNVLLHGNSWIELLIPLETPQFESVDNPPGPPWNVLHFGPGMLPLRYCDVIIRELFSSQHVSVLCYKLGNILYNMVGYNMLYIRYILYFILYFICYILYNMFYIREFPTSEPFFCTK